MSKMRFSVITPVSDRPEAFNLLADCMRRQEFDGYADWIIVDDSHEPVSVEWPPGSISLVPKIFREQPTDGCMTLARNLLCGYQHVQTETIVFCETQSWYRFDYLERLVSAAERDGISIAGYPHVRWYFCWDDMTWVEEVEAKPVSSCLCRTAIRGSAARTRHQGILERTVKHGGSGSGDTPLWRGSTESERSFIDDMYTAVKFLGIKGKLRYSSGGTHPQVSSAERWGSVETPDPQGEKLTQWMGAENARKYSCLGRTR